MSQALILYTRRHCTLCEQAAALAASARVAVRPVDIGGDLDLLLRYGDRIPVLKNPLTGAEIGWPFDAGMVTELAAHAAKPGHEP